MSSSDKSVPRRINDFSELKGISACVSLLMVMYIISSFITKVV
ncbi:hypothetical protein [Peptoclostridium sp.]|nr:hypothetical protein [Peptoclostridium sp.]